MFRVVAYIAIVDRMVNCVPYTRSLLLLLYRNVCCNVMYVAISNVRELVEKGEKSSVFYHWSQLLVSPNARIYGIGGSRHTTSNFVFLFSFQTACAPNETHLFAYIRIPLILVLLSTHKYGVSRVPKSKNTHHPFGVYECASLGLPRSVIVWWSMS